MLTRLLSHLNPSVACFKFLNAQQWQLIVVVISLTWIEWIERQSMMLWLQFSMHFNIYHSRALAYTTFDNLWAVFPECICCFNKVMGCSSHWCCLFYVFVYLFSVPPKNSRRLWYQWTLIKKLRYKNSLKLSFPIQVDEKTDKRISLLSARQLLTLSLL